MANLIPTFPSFCLTCEAGGHSWWTVFCSRSSNIFQTMRQTTFCDLHVGGRYLQCYNFSANCSNLTCNLSGQKRDGLLYWSCCPGVLQHVDATNEARLAQGCIMWWKLILRQGVKGDVSTYRGIYKCSLPYWLLPGAHSKNTGTRKSISTCHSMLV